MIDSVYNLTSDADESENSDLESIYDNTVDSTDITTTTFP